eukprot:CCRYP_005315-RA/>CCRYP_005315-RA protein AED:0.00 eAED:0.00 QI:130/-1/1/1/-1/1/1/257/946
MGWFRAILQIAQNRTAASPELIADDIDAFPTDNNPSSRDDFTFGFEEVFVTLALFIFGYIVLATPCRPLRSAFALHIRIHPGEWIHAAAQLRHVRSASDARLWWNHLWKHHTVERRIHQQQRWHDFLRSGRLEDEYDPDRTVRASGGNGRGLNGGGRSTPLTTLFRPCTLSENKIHISSSDGRLIESCSPTKNQTYIKCQSSSGDSEVRQETDQDRFERAWKTYIHNAEYNRLVLPPECKLVNTPHSRESEQNTLEESPWHKTIAYIQNLYEVWIKLFSVEGAKRFLLWVMNVVRYKLRKRRGLPVDEDEEEEEDDDGSVATLGTICNSPKVQMKRVTRKIGDSSEASAGGDCGKTPRAKVSNVKSEYDPSIMNIPSLNQQEKQDKSMNLNPRARVDTGDDDTFISAAGADVADKVSSHIPDADIPLTVVSKRSQRLSPVAANLFHRSQSALKKKDALESYRQHATMMPMSCQLAQDRVEQEWISPIPSPKMKHSNDDHADVPGLNFFDTANSDRQLRDMSRAVPIPDANGFILGDEFISASCTPLLVFVNSRSGSQQGNFLMAQFRRLLNPIQVWDLGIGGPEKVLRSFSVLTRFQILVCGGDGTVSWILSVLERMKLKRWPPIAILPLGTGNDLARIHGWGGGYNNESLLYILRQISEAYISMLDLWQLDITDKKGKRKAVKSFTNYLGVGVDAQAALQVHMLRESTPTLFFSRFYNKVWYALAGGEEAIKSSCANLPQQITLVADGVEIHLPPDSQGIIFLNIDSYSGGVPLWSKGQKPLKRKIRSHSEGDFLRGNGTKAFARVDSIEDIFTLESESSRMSLDERLAKVTACDLPSSCQDGLLDVVSIRGTFHLGQIRVGLSNAQLLCQCREAVVTLKKKVAIQIDGEPWRQNPSILRISRKNDRATMLNRSSDDSGGVESEVAKLLDWASEKNVIDRNQYTV